MFMINSDYFVENCFHFNIKVTVRKWVFFCKSVQHKSQIKSTTIQCYKKWKVKTSKGDEYVLQALQLLLYLDTSDYVVALLPKSQITLDTKRNEEKYKNKLWLTAVCME